MSDYVLYKLERVVLALFIVLAIIDMGVLTYKAAQEDQGQATLTQGAVTAKAYRVDRAQHFLVTLRGEAPNGTLVTETYDARERDFDAVNVGDTVKVADLYK